MREGPPGKRAPKICWQKFLLWGLVVSAALNFYLAEKLSRLADSPSPVAGGGSETARSPADETGDAPNRPPAKSLPSGVGYSFDRELAEAALADHGRDAIFQPLRAYTEKKLNDTVPGTIDKGNLNEKKPKVEVGRPAKWYVPLPLRGGAPEDLRMFEYGHRLRSCNDMPAKLPIDRGLGKHVSRNVNNRDTFSSGKLDVWEEAREGSPVQADPFLPWIHDMFPNDKGTVVHFVAQNKRRCNSGKVHWEDIHALEPQVTIMQPVSVKRIDETTARRLAPELWGGGDEDEGTGTRYRLAAHEEAESDGMFTRFICRFRAMDYTKSPPELLNVGETLSTFPYNYEYVNYRKDLGDLSMLTPKGKDNPMFWQSQLRFDCPVPDNGDLRSAIASGNSVLSDGTPSIYVDVVPIRTAPRYAKRMSYFTPDMAGETLEIKNDHFGWSDLMTNNIVRTEPTRNDSVDRPPRRMKNGFDPWLFWGDKHVLPRIEASGRWENLPVCRSPGVGYDVTKADVTKEDVTKEVATTDGNAASSESTGKRHKLIACLWASASFTTRGNAQAVSDTTTRLLEWIEFHLLVGFDHIYVYDNSGAHTDQTSLEPTLFPRFSESEVTRIDWPCRVCNNNIPAHENTGERSSQYAAENSCRARYGPYTEWMASFDTDEYLIPMGKYNSMREVVDDATKSGAQILTFKSTRAIPIQSYMEPFHDHADCGTESEPSCLRVREGSLFAEVYNCDFEKSPKPSWAERAKKQLYRADYVYAHYVHYATVTGGLLRTKEEAKRLNKDWYMHYRETKASDRYTDEINQAVMLHSKTTVPEYTTDWKTRCEAGHKAAYGKNCRVGFPWPRNDENGPDKSTPNGFGYNCFTNEKLADFWLPKLHDAIEKRNVRIDHLRNMNII